jgi:hypothetical protein
VTWQRFLAARVEADPRQRCHYEDLYVGRYVAQHPRLSLVNLDSMLGHKDVWQSGTRKWLGADSFLAHWVRDHEAFLRVSRGFEERRAMSSANSLDLHCMHWADSFELLPAFSCCQNWTVCEPATPTLRRRATSPPNAEPLNNGLN